MVLNLYLLARQDDVGLDETESVLVAAVTPKNARELARTVEGTQPPEVWAHGRAKLQKIGTAVPSIRQGIIHYSRKDG